MKSVFTVLLGAGLLLLTACGGGSEEANVADNSVETLTVEDETTLAPTDDLLNSGNEVTPAEANALDNAIDATLPEEPLVIDNASVNSQ